MEPTPPPINSRRPPQQSFWLGLMLGLGLGALLTSTVVISGVYLSKASGAAQALGAIQSGDNTKAAIRQWLKSHLDDGRWQEVKWLRTTPAENGEFYAVCRFRSKNKFGATVISDEVFWIQRSGAVVHEAGTIGEARIVSNNWHEWSER